jgi:hypothetical protein
MISMIIGWAMIEDLMALHVRGHSIHLIKEIIVPDEKESRTLGSLRDSLLPRLMRGEVRVSAL